MKPYFFGLSPSRDLTSLGIIVQLLLNKACMFNTCNWSQLNCMLLGYFTTCVHKINVQRTRTTSLKRFAIETNFFLVKLI